LLFLLVLGTALFVALLAVLYSRQKEKARDRFKSKYRGIPTDDLDADRFSFDPEEGIDLSWRSGGRRERRKEPYRDDHYSTENSMDDVLIDLGNDSSESDFVMSQEEEEEEEENDADIDDVPYKREDFSIDNADDEFDIELSDEDTGFAGF
jgi:hypothetical protein